jgi:riboflavin biosynthesis pyrimidine reductase
MVGVQSLWPTPPEAELTDADLERVYGYPEALTRPWIQANFVSSADGAVTVDDRSEGLSHPADKRIFRLGRDLADVVLVGAGTARTEKYRGARVDAERRARHGLSAVPPIAVVTNSASIDPEGPLLTDTRVPPIVIAPRNAPQERLDRLAYAGAELLLAGDRTVDLVVALDELSKRGLRRVNCEGGPHLFGELIAENLVDQLCLTVAPLLAGAGAGRISAGRLSGAARRMELASVLHEDGFTMLRYRRGAG